MIFPVFIQSLLKNRWIYQGKNNIKKVIFSIIQNLDEKRKEEAISIFIQFLEDENWNLQVIAAETLNVIGCSNKKVIQILLKKHFFVLKNNIQILLKKHFFVLKNNIYEKFTEFGKDFLKVATTLILLLIISWIVLYFFLTLITQN